LVQGLLDLVEENQLERVTTNSIPLSSTFFNPELMYVPGELDKFLVGLATQPRQKFDNVVSQQLTNHLFQGKNNQFGMDLVALNIQRGRDHGLPGYNAFREVCGFGRVKQFDLLTDLIPVKIVERLKLLYSHVDDIDLFVGGISETAENESILGPTFRCIVADQFERLQTGDRYFYDQGNSNPGRFTPHQLVEVRKSSLARVHCDNGDDINLMQPLSFRKQSHLNPLVPCDAITIPRLNLLPWKEGLQILSPSPILFNNSDFSSTVSDLRQPKEVNFENVNEELNDVFENQEEKALSGPSPDFNIDVNFG